MIGTAKAFAADLRRSEDAKVAEHCQGIQIENEYLFTAKDAEDAKEIGIQR